MIKKDLKIWQLHVAGATVKTTTKRFFSWDKMEYFLEIIEKRVNVKTVELYYVNVEQRNEDKYTLCLNCSSYTVYTKLHGYSIWESY